MKKAIGLTANTSDFRPNLPQTKHLNYFMGTNPIYMAKGGDVKAGIPNYPDVNVTRGFLPAALGFAPGGEASSWDFAKNLLKQFDNDIIKLLNFLQNILGYSKEDAENIVNKITTPSDRQPGLDVSPETLTPKDTVTTTPSDRQPGLDVSPETLTPKDTVTENIIPGGYYGAPPATSQTTPGIGPRLETSPGESSGAPQDTGGITEMEPEKKDDIIEELPFYMKPFDFNKDGKITNEDLEIAKKFGYDWAIKPILDWLGLSETDPEELPDIEIEPDLENGKKEDDKKEDDKGGITEIKPSDRQPGLEQEDQETLKKGSEIMGKSNQEQIEIANTRGINAIDPNVPDPDDTDPDKKKKDVPAWALPMMSAGFAMMASKSPYFLQALGEGGQEGIKTLTAQQEGESKRELEKAQKEALEARAAYDRGEGRSSSGTPMVIGGKYYYKDGTPYMIVQDGKQVHASATMTREDAITLLTKNNPMFAQLPFEEQEKQITAIMNLYNLGDQTVTSTLPQDENKGDGFGSGIIDWGKDWLGLKDGGIVTLRR